MESIMKGWKLGLLVGSFGLTSNAFAQQRPNILWLTYEDTSPQFIGCYGNKEAKTPVMDGLAAEGVRFTNSYSTGTVSSPSRFVLLRAVVLDGMVREIIGVIMKSRNLFMASRNT